MTATRMALPSIMRAIRLSEFGGPEILKVATEVVLPKPGPSEVIRKLDIFYEGLNTHRYDVV